MDEHKTAVRGDEDTAARRKSLGRLRDMSVAFDVEPSQGCGGRPSGKYSRNDDTDPGCPSGGGGGSSTTVADLEPAQAAAAAAAATAIRAPPGMSAMEMESIKERERAALLRKCAQLLELDSVNGKYTRENFKRGILNKVSGRFIVIIIFVNTLRTPRNLGPYAL